MALKKRFLQSLALATVCVCASSDAYSQSGEDRSYVMLLNGNVFHGVAKPLGDKVEIRISDGNAIHVDSRQIALIAPTKLELYQRQVKGASRVGASEHWYLTQWCIQEELVDQAIYHFEELSKVVEHNDKYKQLEHKLKEAIFNSEKVRSLLGERHPSYNKTSGRTEGNAAPVAEVVQASANQPMKSLTAEQQVLLNSMPSYVKKSFQSHITPLLVSRCGQAGCHGVPGAGTDFHLRQAVGGQAALAAASNLENVIRYVNPQSPVESELIAYATRAHGSQSKPRFVPHVRDDDHRHIERITQWIKSLSLATPAGATNIAINMPAAALPTASLSMPATGTANGVVSAVDVRAVNASANDGPVSAVANSTNANGVAMQVNAIETISELDGRSAKIREWKEFGGEQDRDVKLSKPAKSGSSTPVFTYDEIKELESEIAKLEQKHAKQPVRDPFDPNYFNQTYGAKK